MITKDVLAKVNKIIAVAVTKNRITIDLSNFTRSGNTLRVGYVQEDYTTSYCGGNAITSYIQLDHKNCFAKLNETLHWLHTLEDRYDVTQSTKM